MRTFIYCWSGIHKLNENFIQFTFQDILSKLFGIQDPELLNTLKPWGYGIGLLEILTGLFLFIPRTRKAGVLLAIGTHVFILIYLSPLGVNRNYIVFPWNLAMIMLVYVAFWEVRNNALRWDFNFVKTTFLNGFALIVAWLLPALNFAGYWDNYLAFSLYSEKVNDYYIIVAETALPQIDNELSAYFLKSDQLQGGQIIDVNKWAYTEMNVPFYPETRVFRQICLPFCHLNIPEGELYFLELEKPAAKGKFYRFTCQDLRP
ncbi:hypothetical protein [Adhaeribacter terreus]|uniref:DoxX family protein n=1 Tax=Adhaeribacter terreus TaxID=529703 RepID=A0ABW0ED61_9BACT